MVREARVSVADRPAGHRARQHLGIRHAPRARHRDLRRGRRGRCSDRTRSRPPAGTPAAVHRPRRRSLGGARVRRTAGARSAAGARLAEGSRATHRHAARGAATAEPRFAGPRAAPGIRSTRRSGTVRSISITCRTRTAASSSAPRRWRSPAPSILRIMDSQRFSGLNLFSVLPGAAARARDLR